jgi:Heparinase II/III-like protein/Domain of unknown function (DUF4962)
MNRQMMRCIQVTLVACLAAPALSFGADWSESTDLSAIRPSPTELQVQAQNPPSFTWSRHPTNTSGYTLELTRQGGETTTFTTQRNWLLPTTRLADGTYSWRVRPTSAPTEWSTVRYFVINSMSNSWQVPDDATLKARAMAHSRPRQLPTVFPMYSTWSAAMIAERGDAMKRLIDDVVGHTSMASAQDADWPLPTVSPVTAALSAQQASIRSRIGLVSHQAEAAALLYRLTGTPAYLNEALRRADEMAALDPNGPTSYAAQDQATRTIALSLARTLDMLWREVDATRKTKWMDVINRRTAVFYADIAQNRGAKLDQFPFDSHGGTALGVIAEIAVLTAGDIPAAQEWFDFAVRAYIHSVSVWSGAEGGYANGTAYGQVSIFTYMPTWGTMKEAIGVNLFDKPWARGFLNFFMHFVPPGSPTHVFGDGHEDIPNPNYLRAFASRFKTPQARWYFNGWSTGKEDALTLLASAAPLPANEVTTAAPPANAAVYPSIGWVAMHSNLTDMKRTSLYFKSSPFGSYNHSHGDQNSFVLHSGGKPLLIEAGYYDWYGSPLWSDWYRATKSHNGITFDNGVGQPVTGNNENLRRKGKITAFSTTASVDYTEGDATAAYDGLLTKALRKIWYLRNQDAVVVLDNLSSATARAFEWNFHAPVAITATGDNAVKIVNGDRSVCIQPLVGGSTYTAKTGAARPGVYEAHGAYVRPASTNAEFLMLIDVGCKKPYAKLTSTAIGRTLQVGTQTITLPK